MFYQRWQRRCIFSVDVVIRFLAGAPGEEYDNSAEYRQEKRSAHRGKQIGHSYQHHVLETGKTECSQQVDLDDWPLRWIDLGRPPDYQVRHKTEK